MKEADLLTAYSWRYATKKFDPARKIPAETWSTLEESLRLSPSSFGLQPWKFLVIDDPKLRAALRPHSWDQSQITDASHLVVFANKTHPSEKDVLDHIKNSAAILNTAVESLTAYRDMMVGYVTDESASETMMHWTARQTYIALGFFLASCALLGVDACPMEGFEREKYDELLGLTTEGLSAAVLCAAGYRAADDKYQHAAKVRFPAENVITHR